MATTTLKYTILAGDTLSVVAEGLRSAAGVSAQAIEQANPDIAPTAMPVGFVLDIPAKSGGATALKYTVLPGDTYSRIADELEACAGITYQEIEQANPGLQPNRLAIGQVIDIPSSGSSDPANPEPVPQPVIDAETIGFWRWTWSRTATPPVGVNLGIAFSGWTDPSTALSASAPVMNQLPGSKYICLGGGNQNGAWTKAGLANVMEAVQSGRFAGYEGIAFDVEEGDSGLETPFQQLFSAAKAQNFKVLVTISHSAPYGIGDGAALMQSFFADPNIDHLSPQLYTTGREPGNDYATSHGVTWQQYAAAKAAIVPSIVSADMYADAQSYFLAQGVTLAGFVQWSQ